MEGDEQFACAACGALRPLDELADLACCSLCAACAAAALLPSLKPVPPKPVSLDTFALRASVLYRTRLGNLAPATIVQIDRSVQPPGYGILLDSATSSDEIRFTEATRLRHADRDPCTGFPALPCPACSRLLSQDELARLFPDQVAALEAELTAAWLTARGVIQCPGPQCGALIELAPAAGGGGGGADSGRVRCSACQATFCAACRACPYHAGLSCEEAAAPLCLLCSSARVLGEAPKPAASAAELRRQIRALGGRCSSCIERSELLAVFARCTQVCAECRASLPEMCGKLLACGHGCCGLRGEADCPPCCTRGCAASGECSYCCEQLSSRAVIQLGCSAGHLVHRACAAKRLASLPGPALSFEFLFCALCRSGAASGRSGNVQVLTSVPHLQHASLAAELARPLELRAQVVALAKARLKRHDARHPLLQPGAKYDGRPVDLALTHLGYQFFECCRCHNAYFGGLRACEPGGGGGGDGGPAAGGHAAGGFDAQELVCHSCCAAAAGSDCAVHGTEAIEYKCKYCCAVASWFCWGTTHMCHACHETPAARAGHTCGPRCPLKQQGIPHAPPGSDCCLGCALCRHRD